MKTSNSIFGIAFITSDYIGNRVVTSVFPYMNRVDEVLQNDPPLESLLVSWYISGDWILDLNKDKEGSSYHPKDRMIWLRIVTPSRDLANMTESGHILFIYNQIVDRLLAKPKLAKYALPFIEAMSLALTEFSNGCTDAPTTT